jgi:vacuolar-type H+-ATPase subunit H
MRDVIQKIVATESEARTIVAEARAEADRISSDAEKKKKTLVEDARLKAIEEAERIVADGAGEAEKEKERLLAAALAEIESKIHLEQDTRERVVEGVVRCVCGLQ